VSFASMTRAVFEIARSAPCPPVMDREMSRATNGRERCTSMLAAAAHTRQRASSG
jgi:hypothetical protein